MDFPIDWLQFLPLATDHERLRLNSFSGEPFYFNSVIPFRIYEWLEGMAWRHNTSAETIAISCLQIGRYIHRAYPRASDPTTHFIQAILNADRLLARARAIRANIGQQIELASGFIAATEASANFVQSEPVGAAGLPSQFVAANGVALDADVPDEIVFSITELPGSPVEDRHAVPPDLLEWLFSSSVLRKTAPPHLFLHCLDTCQYLDLNFDSVDRPILEDLLYKVIALDRIGLDASRSLSAVETYLADWPDFLDAFIYRFTTTSS